MELAEQIYNAYMGVRSGGNADECRATLRSLREQHGDTTFEMAKFRALSFDAKHNS